MRNLDKEESIYGDRHDSLKFRLSINTNRRIVFTWTGFNNIVDTVISSTKVSLDSWTHLTVTLDHVKGISLIYADGVEVGHKEGVTEIKINPSNTRYKIGSSGKNHFNGSVMDLYVFGAVLSPKEINKLRGWCVIRLYQHHTPMKLYRHSLVARVECCFILSRDYFRFFII